MHGGSSRGTKENGNVVPFVTCSTLRLMEASEAELLLCVNKLCELRHTFDNVSFEKALRPLLNQLVAGLARINAQCGIDLYYTEYSKMVRIPYYKEFKWDSFYASLFYTYSALAGTLGDFSTLSECMTCDSGNSTRQCSYVVQQLYVEAFGCLVDGSVKHEINTLSLARINRRDVMSLMYSLVTVVILAMKVNSSELKGWVLNAWNYWLPLFRSVFELDDDGR